MITWKDVTDSEEFQSSSRPVQLEIYRRWIEDEVAKEFDNDPYILDHFRNQPMDTGQGVIATTANAAAQNVLGTIPTAIAGVGAMTGSQGMEEFGKGGMEYAAEAFPTNPANPNAAMFGNVIGNVGTMAFGGAGLAKSALALGATKMGALVAAKAGTLLVGGAMGGVEGAQAADQAGLTGFDRQLGAMIGGAKEIASETMLFGMGTETALARRMLGMAGKKPGGIIRSVFQEAGEEGVGQFGQNVGIRALADDDKQPGLFDDVASSTFWGGVGGGLFGGLNLTLLNGTILPPAAASDVRPVTSEAEIAEGEVPVFHQGKLVGAKPVIQQEEFEPIADLIEELPPAASAVVESTDIAAKSLDETAKIAPEAVAATSRVVEDLGITDVAEVPVEEVVTEEVVVEPPVEQVEIPYAERPSPNLAPRADFQSPSRPEKRGEERDAWDEQFGMDRRGGRSHNDDGTPYQPTVHDETVAVALASLKGKSDEERIDAIGDQHETTVSNSIKRLLNAGWIWDANSGKMVNPQNPSERPIDFLVGKKQDQEVTAEIAAEKRNKEMFPDQDDFGGKFSTPLQIDKGSYVNNDGIESVNYLNPETGEVDVVISAFGNNDFAAYMRQYDENGNPTNTWTSKLERRTERKGATRAMVEELQSRLPQDHKYTEDVSVSTDGLRFILNQLNQGYEVSRDENGDVETSSVAISGESIKNDLPIAVDPNGKFDNIRVTTPGDFAKVKSFLAPILERFGAGLSEKNIRWEDGTVFIDIPVLRKTSKSVIEQPKDQEVIDLTDEGAIVPPMETPTTEKTPLRVTIPEGATSTKLGSFNDQILNLTDEANNAFQVHGARSIDDVISLLSGAKGEVQVGKMRPADDGNPFSRTKTDRPYLVVAKKGLDGIGEIGTIAGVVINAPDDIAGKYTSERELLEKAGVLTWTPREYMQWANSSVSQAPPTTQAADATSPEPIAKKKASPEVDISTDTETPEAWDRANRHQQSNEWFEGGRANLAVNEAFNRAATNGGADLATHGMAKVATLSGAIKALTDLLKNGLDQSRGRDADGARLHTAPLAVERDSAAVHAGTTSGGTSYRDGPFILVNSAAASRSDVGIRTMDTVQAVLVNEANAGQLDAIRKAIHAIRPDIIVELYSKADQVAATLTGKKGKVAEGVKKVIPVVENVVARDVTKPEQMTPEEYDANSGEIHSSSADGEVYPTKAKAEDAMRKWTSRNGGVFERLIEDDFGVSKEELFSVFKTKRGGWVFGQNQAATIIANLLPGNVSGQLMRRPVSASAVDTYGINLPEGYIRQGDLYVFQPSGTVEAVTETVPPAKKTPESLLSALGGGWKLDGTTVSKDGFGHWTESQRDEIRAVFKKAGILTNTATPSGSGNRKSSFTIPSDDARRIQDEVFAEEVKLREAKKEQAKADEATKQAEELSRVDPAAKQWMDSLFGRDDFANPANKVHLSDFVTGKTAKFGGMVNPRWLDGVQAAGAVLEGGKVDFQKLKENFESSVAKPAPPAKPAAEVGTGVAGVPAPKEPEYISPKEIAERFAAESERNARRQSDTVAEMEAKEAAYKPPVRQSGAELLEEYKSQQKAKPAPPAKPGQRDVTKPEQMTPEEFVPVGNPVNQGIFKSKKEASVRLSELEETVSKSQQMLGILAEFNLVPSDAYEVAKDPAGRWSLGATHKHRIALAAREKQPVSKAAVDAYGITLPEGYTRQGDLYVYAPTAPTNTPTETALPQASKEVGPQVSTEPRTETVRGKEAVGGELKKPEKVGNTQAIPTPEEEARWDNADKFNRQYVEKLDSDSLDSFGEKLGIKRQGVSDSAYREKILGNTHPDDILDAIPDAQPSAPSPLSLLRKSVAAELPEKAQNKWTPEVYAAAEKYFKSKNLRDLDSLTQPQRDRIQRALYDAFPEQAKAQKDADKAELQKIKEDRKAMDKDANPTPKELSFDPIKPSVYALTGNPAAPLTDEQLKQEIAARKQGKLPNRDMGVYVRLFAGNMVSKGVSMDEARAAMQNEAASIPGVNKDVWIGTSAEFDAEFPGKSPAGAAEAVITTIDGRSVVAIFTDRVEVREADVTNAANNQTTRGVEAVRRLLRHEVFGHRGFSALPVELRQRFFDMMDAGLVPESDLDAIVNAGYRSFADWRTNVASRHALHEEWLAGRMEGAERIPSTGLVARFMDWLSDVWRHITGSTRNEYPTLDELKDTMRAMHKALADLQNRDASGNFQNPSDLANRYSYAGANAQLPQFMQDSLETAKAMAAAGKTSEEIRAITGWFPGKYDGKMRWEIPDDGAKLKDDFGKAKVVSDLIDHPALFDAYPSIAEVPVVFSGFTAGITKDGKTLILPLMTAKFGSDNAALLGGVLHEIQHLIQAIEGFARGGNTEGIYAAEKLAIEKKKAELESIRDAAKVAYEKRVTDANLAAWKAAVDDVWEVMGEKPARRTREEELDYYRRIAGEIESRDIEARKNLTPEQRKAIAPYSSENIAKEDAIVMFDSGATKYALGTAQDAEYLAAVEAGDSGSDNLIQLLRDAPESKRKAVVDAWLQRNPKAAANMQRMVDAAAKAAGYDREAFKAMPEKDWRTDEPINVINSTNGPWAGFFTDTKGVADRFGRIMRQPVRRAFLKLTKPFEVDASGKAAGELQFDILDDSGTHAQKNNAEILAAINSGSYDSIILKNTVDEGTVIVPLDPSQIKSADPITYDDAGNIIPLSQRFQETSPDIRYALGTGGSDTILSGTYPQPKLKVSDQKPPKIIADIEFDKIDKDNKYTGTALLYESVDFKDKFIPWAYDTMTPELAEWTAANANNKEAIYARMGIGNVRSDAPLAVFYAAASLKAPSFAAKAVLADAHKNLITDVAQTLAVQGVAQYSKELGAFYAEQSVMDLMRKYRDRVLNENLGKEGSAESVAPKIQEAAKVAGDVVNDAVESIDSEIELAVAATEDPEIKGWLTDIFNALVKKARLLKHLAFLRSKKAIGTGDEFGSFDADLSKLTEEETLKLIAEQDGIMVDRKKKTQNKMRERSAKAKPTDEQMASEGEKRARAIISRIKASSKGKTAKERSAEAKAVDAMYAKHLKSPMTEQEFLKGAEGILEEKTAKELYSQSLIEIANREIRATKKASGQGRADAIIARIKASANGKPVKERTEQAKAVDKLFSDHVSSPMSEDEFLKRAKGLMDEKTALELFKQAAAKRQRALDDEVDPDTLAKELMKADATRLKGTEKEGKIPKFDSIEKLYNLAKKQGDQDRAAFVKAMMDFGVSEENANALFGYAKMYRESQTPGRKSGGTVSSVFSSQVKSPEPYQAFKDKLKKFNVRPSVVDALFAAARNETALRQKDAVEARKRDLVNIDTGDMMRLVSRLRSKLGNINWASVFNQSQAMQGTLQERIADAVEQELQNQSPQIKKIQDRIDALETGDPNIPELQKQIEDLRKTIKPLSEAERKAIGAAVADVFERAQKGYLDGVMKRIADSPRIKAEAAEKLKNALPKLIRAYNNGLLGREEYHNIMAQEFGLKEFSQATFDKAKKIVSDIQETNSPTVRRQKTFELAELVQKNADIPLAEILQSFWIISVLTGVRTHFAMFTAAWNGFRAVFQSAVDAAVFKRSPGAAIKSIRAFVKAFFKGIHEVMVYAFNAEPTMIDSFEQSQNVFLDGMQGSKLFSAAERLVMKGGKGKVFGSYMAFFERLMRAWDHITSTSTVAGLRETAAILNPEIYNAALKPSEADIKATEKFVADAHWNGTRPTGAVDKIIFDSQVRQNIDQIYIERLKAEKQALIDSGALAEAKNKQDDIQSYQRFIDDVRAVGSSAAYQEDPKGVGGFIYTRLKGFTGGLGVASKAKLEASMKEFQMNKAEMDLRDNVTERIKLGVLWTQYLAATMARPILGLQFVRFVGNRLNEIISFTPGLGLLRASFEEQFQGGKNAALKRLIVQNQVVGTALAIVGYYALKALKDEPDEEKRGWSISGSWGNLTPDRKSQLMSAGKSPFSLTIWMNGKPVNLSYNDWPIASILATVGSINDIRSYTPDRWAEKSDTDHLFSAIWAGSSSFMDMSALSGFMDSIGSSAYSTEPDTAFIQKLNKTAANFAGGFIPRFLKDIDFMISEETNRVSSSDLFGRWAKELPFYRRNVGEPMIDILGNQVKTPRTPWSRAIKLGPEDDAYKLLGALNSRGLWLGGVNAANRRIGYGNKRRELTADEALTFEVEAGKLYREILKRHGERLIKMPYAAAKDMISKLTKTARDRAFNKVRQMAARG